MFPHHRCSPSFLSRHECVEAEALVQRGVTYDLVLASEVIEHVNHPDQFVRTLSQLLRQPESIDDVVPSGRSSRSSSSRDSTVMGGGDRRGGTGGGLLVVSTMNRTAESFAVAIVGAEYVTRVVPRGTHDWHRFITPLELTLMAGQVRAHTDGWTFM